MQVQYLTDDRGHKKSVVIPYGEWERLLKEIEKQRVLLGIKSAMREVKEMTSGKKRLPSLAKLLNEL